MPDRDVFDRNVSRGWQRAARQLMGNADDPEVLRSVVRAFGKEIKHEGCPGFDAIVRIVIDARGSPNYQHAKQCACDQLEQLRCDQASSITELATNCARRLLVKPLATTFADLQPLTVAVEILGELAVAWLCPRPLLYSLVEEDRMSYQAVQAQCERGRTMLVNSPEFLRIAEMLLSDPSGASVRTPQMRRPKMSQADILVTALTE